MAEYRAFFIGQDGCFFKSVIIYSDDDNTAVESARQLVNGYNVELWQQDRRVVQLSSEQD